MTTQTGTRGVYRAEDEAKLPYLAYDADNHIYPPQDAEIRHLEKLYHERVFPTGKTHRTQVDVVGDEHKAKTLGEHPVGEHGGAVTGLVADFGAECQGAGEARVVDQRACGIGVRRCFSVDADQATQPLRPAAGHRQATQAQLAGLGEGLLLAAAQPDGGMGLLDGFGVDFPRGNLEMAAVVRELAFGPSLWDDFQGFIHHAGGVLQVRAEGSHLVGISGAAHTQVDPALAEDIQGRHPSGDLQRMLNRRHNHGDAQSHAGGPLADGPQGDVRGTGVGPLGAKLVVRQPHALQAHLFGERDLLQHLPVAVRLGLGSPGLGHLDLVEHADLHY